MDNIIEEFYITLEETRNKLSSFQKISSEEISDFHASLDEIYLILHRLYDDMPMDNDSVYVAMIYNCKSKAAQLAIDAVAKLLITIAKIGIVDDGIEVQKDIADIVELSIRFRVENLHEQSLSKGPQISHETIQFISTSYTKYQRQLLRHRSKPSISSLANIRKDASLNSQHVISNIELSLESKKSDEEDFKSQSAELRPYSLAITSVLSEASSLIDPLILWKEGTIRALNHLESKKDTSTGSEAIDIIEKDVQYVLRNLCHDTALALHTEAILLTGTVCEWFLSDIRELDQDPYDKNLNIHVYPSDGMLDEMVFVCQVINRYISFSQTFVDGNERNLNLSLVNLLTECVLLYTTQETKLITSNIRNARALSQPVQVLMGVPRFVPSVVEDIYFITQRSLERASVSMVPKALSILASFITEIWSASGAVYDSLMKQEGCCLITVNEVEEKSSFGALLSKLDLDEKQKEPSSGKNLDIHQIQMNAQLCLLNGIHAASSACLNLSNLIVELMYEEDEANIHSRDSSISDGMDLKSNSMIHFANDEAKRHSKFYEDLLRSQINEFVEEWIGVVNNTSQKPPLVASLPQSPCLHRMFHFFSNEEYNINASAFQTAESHERIELMLEPLKCSRIMHELRTGKCDDDVSLHLVSICSNHIARMLLSTLLDQKKFSEWGSLLLSKQIRNLEGYLCSQVIQNESSINTSMILREFQKLNQTVTILQCAKPSDWSAFEGEVGNSSFDLTKEEIKKIMMLRLDWSIDSINLQFR